MTRTTATSFLSTQDAFAELDRLKFAFAALVDRYPKGSYDAEMAENALKGVKARIDYLHDSFFKLLTDARTDHVSQVVADALTKVK